MRQVTPFEPTPWLCFKSREKGFHLLDLGKKDFVCDKFLVLQISTENQPKSSKIV